MNELTITKALPIERKLCNGAPVVTLRDIDAAHQRPEGTARRNYNYNKKRFIEGVDYYVRNSHQAAEEYGINAPNGLTLFTMTGYLMIVKSFTDDLSWAIQRELVNGYFANRRSGYRYMNSQVFTLADYCEASKEKVDTVQRWLSRNQERFAMGEVLRLEGTQLAQFRRANAGYIFRGNAIWVMTQAGAEKIRRLRSR